MPQPIQTQLGTFTSTGSGTPRAGQAGDHTFAASLTGSGAVSASVLIEVSNDLAGWTTLTTLTLSGTGSASAQASSTASHAYWRATVSSISAGASLTVVAATEEAAGGGGGQFTAAEAAAIRGVVSRDGISTARRPNGIFSKYSATAFDITRAETSAGYGVSATNVTHSISNERTRWNSYSRKVVIGSANADFKARSTGTGAPLNIFADPTHKAFQISIYFEDNPNEFLAPSNPYMVIYLSNLWSGGANQSRWSIDTGYLRQGWNIITLRADDVIGASAGLGDMPAGVTRNSDLGQGFNWDPVSASNPDPGDGRKLGSLEYVHFNFVNFNGATVHIDEIRRAPKAVPVLVIGFDAIGAFGNDEVMYTKVAPLFAKNGIKSYATLTKVYDLVFAGGAGWTRFQKLQDEYGWDAIPHSWSHGATTLGANLTLASLVAASDVVTITYASPHGIPLGRVYKGKITGASIAQANGVFDLTATSTTQATYTATGAGSATATGTIRINTFLSEVFATDTAENRRLVAQELVRNVEAMRANGYGRGAGFLAYPNNSVPHIDVLRAACDTGRIRLGRGARGGYTFLDEIGIDNPLNFGSFILDNGVTLATKTSYIAGKVQGAFNRGCHLQVFGHFILDDEDPANAAYKPVDPDSPPGINGNPAPPGGASQTGGGWWYLSQLRRLVEDTIAPLMAQGMLVMSPSEYVDYMGYAR